MPSDLTDEYIIELIGFIRWADGLLGFALVLIIADLFFGVKKALKNNEDVRPSRALRRSIDKICSYVLWVLIAFGLGEVFGELLGVVPAPLIALGIIYFIELESIAKNYFEWRGLKIKVNLLKFITRKTDIIEIDQDNKDNQDETNI